MYAFYFLIIFVVNSHVIISAGDNEPKTSYVLIIPFQKLLHIIDKN